jgi:hypothetical protein
MSAQHRPGRPASVRDVPCRIRLTIFSRAAQNGLARGKIDEPGPLFHSRRFLRSSVHRLQAHRSWTVDPRHAGFMPRPRTRLVLYTWLLMITPLIAAAPAVYARGAAEWMWPLDPTPVVLRPFEPPSKPWLAGHRGVDLSARLGQHVRSAGAGVVTFAGMVAGLPVMTVSHGVLRTTYEPVEPAVQAGDRVRAGDPIGRLSRAGAHCGARRPCLHWGLLRGGTYLDPLALLRSGPIRLLPRDTGTSGAAGAAADGARTRRSPVGHQQRDRGLSYGQAAIIGGSALALGVLAFATRRRRREAGGVANLSGG